jgi:TolB protein
MVIRFLIIAVGIVIWANIPARAGYQHPVLRTYAPMRIALPDFAATDPSEVGLARSISQIIASDLKRDGAFVPVDPASFAEKKADIDQAPYFEDWRVIKAQGLVVGRVTRQPDARIRVEFRLWDAFIGHQLAGQIYIGSPDDLDHIGHMISQDIYERITGEKRSFD